MKNLFLLLVAVCFSLQTTAQTNLDSLWTIWNDKTQPDTTRLKAMYDIAWKGYLFSQPDSGFYYAQMQYDFAEKSGLKKQMAEALNVQGASFYLRGDYPKAQDYYHRSLMFWEQIGDKKGIAVTSNNIGGIYKEQGDYPRALNYYQRSLRIKEEMGDQKGIAVSLGNVAIIYQDQDDYLQALDYHQRSLAISEEIGDKKGISVALNNIGGIYKEQGNNPKALDYSQRSLKIDEEIGYKRGIATDLNNIGSIHQDQGDFHKALNHFQRSLKIKEEIGDQNGIAYSLCSIGVLYQKQGNPQKSINECSKGLLLAQEIGVASLQRDACQCLYDAYKIVGNDNKALEYLEQLSVLNDSLFNEESTKKLTQLEMQYEFDKKEAATQAEQEKKDAIALQELKRQKMARNGFMGGFAVVLLFAGVFFVQRNRIGKEKERSEELLLNILPEETAQELKEKGHSDAQLIDEVTVLFTDFKGFTALSEQVTPKELVKDLHECFSAFDRICEKYGIEKIKTIGDAYMAAGGLPSPNTTHAQDVVSAALEMREIVEKGKMKKVEQGQPYFEIRIGVHTGPVVAGIVGVKKFQYDIWGDTVNTASRMESSGEVGKVNISEATYKSLKDDAQLVFESRGKIEAKGKGEMEMYFVSQKG